MIKSAIAILRLNMAITPSSAMNMRIHMIAFSAISANLNTLTLPL